ncbi:MFS transporter [Vogesella oryzae]|uniref:MFS transporter n=1 Tax=Vogesella oryzae TaxID=1735285 RepID=UPI0015838138|nr:MFS transporter [Vogesella oryzae]
MNARQLALAGLGGLPLAMVALPLYVHTPALYAREFGVALGSLGVVLFACRLLDTLLDPLLGRWQDRLAPARQHAANLLAAIVGLGGYGWLLYPQAGMPLLAQLALALLLVYLAHGWLNIALLRYGAALWPTPAGRMRVAAWREGWGVLGVLLAAALPAWWAASSGELAAMRQFLWWLLPCSVLALLAAALAPAAAATLAAGRQGGDWWRSRRLQLAGAVLLLNALAMALPATLFQFYVADVLQLGHAAGPLLLLYFLAAMLAMPLWVRLADRVGKVRAWRGGMLLALLGFVPVLWLAAGALAGFALVCVLTGMALGADLAFGSALVADELGDNVASHGGAAFGVVSMLGKLALALAAGIALPLAQWSGYQPGEAAGGLLYLYAGLPAICKLSAWWLLRRLPQTGESPCGNSHALRWR